MDRPKIYCCVPVKFKEDGSIQLEIEMCKNYYLAAHYPVKAENVDFVSNYVEEGQSRNYSLPEIEYKNARIEELAIAVGRLTDVSEVIFHPNYKADDVCGIIEMMCKTYQFKTRMTVI